MNVIVQPKESIMNDLGPQLKSLHKHYRLMRYCLSTDIDGGKLIYNTLTKALIWIKDSEYENLLEDFDVNYDYIEFLVRTYFVVPEQFDEFDLVNQLREKRKPVLTDNWLDHPKGFTILTTTQCNARCFYCYENPVKDKKPMTKKTAKKIIKYIQRVAPTKNIELRWFGGEPLFNYEIIDFICERLLSLGYKFTSNIISNGYLFDEELCKRAKYVWNLKSVLITLDGTQDVYNKTKRYIYKDDSNPFERVLNNIQNLVDLEISTSIRMNCDRHNAEDLKELVKYLGIRFKDSNYFHMYAYPLFELNGFCRTAEHRKEIFDKLEEIDKAIIEAGFTVGKQFNEGDDIKFIHCMTDTGQDVLISTEGDLGLCEHYINEDFWGHIDNPEMKNWEIINSWRLYSVPKDLCKTCPIYPTCLKSVKCPDCNVCDENWYKREVKHVEYSIIHYYNRWKKGDFNQMHKCESSQCCNKYDNQIINECSDTCDKKDNKKWYNKIFKWL